MVGGEWQVENYSGWLQMKSSGGLPRGTRVVNFRWRATALGNDGGELEMENYIIGQETENNTGGLQMENVNCGRLAAGEELHWLSSNGEQ